MILVLDVGNSQIFCGVFEATELVSQFRYASTSRGTSDEIGVFLRGALRENGIEPEQVVKDFGEMMLITNQEDIDKI